MPTYKFCPVCAGRLRRINRQEGVCSKCQRRHFLIPKITTSLVLENDLGEILFALRKHDPWRGKWNTPGGFIDLGENAEQAARREAKEEVGVKLKDIHYLGSFLDSYAFEGLRYPLLAFAFVSKIGRQKVRAGGDAARLKFFSSRKIPYAKIGVPSDRRILKHYLASRSKLTF